jgi:tRNA pseudouridine32 synthase / 23S rRNA pseudouridine746 synthase
MSFHYAPPPHSKLDIIYIDEDLLLVNKPSGLLSVPGRGDDKQDCLINRITTEYSNALIVHRLDMDTSGLMIIARNKNSHRLLSNLFEQRQVIKEYVAVVNGIIKEGKGEVNLPLITDWPNRPKQKVDHQSGKQSITHYEIIERNTKNNQTRVKLKPVTGRSHQLRVHMQSLGHPISGDRLYADKINYNKSSRLLLHASFLEFTHPVSKQLISIKLKAPF